MDGNIFKIVLSEDGVKLPIPIKSEIFNKGIFSLVDNEAVPLHSDILMYIFYSCIPLSKHFAIKLVHVTFIFSFKFLKNKIKEDLIELLKPNLQAKVKRNEFNLLKYIESETNENTTFEIFENKLEKDSETKFNLNFAEIKDDINNILKFENFDSKLFKHPKICQILQNHEIISHVINNFMDVNEKDKKGKSLIHYVFKYSNDKIIFMFLLHFKNLLIFENKDKKGKYPLLLLCKYAKNNKIISDYISFGVDILCRDDNGNTMIDYLCKNPHLTSMQKQEFVIHYLSKVSS